MRKTYNLRKINSAIKLSGCIPKEQPKMVIALPTKNNVMDVFEETITGGFSCLNTGLSYTEILMSNLTKSNNSKMSFNESFRANKRDDVKVIRNIKLSK